MMAVHTYAAMARRRARGPAVRSGPAVVRRAHPDVLALARILAAGDDRRVQVVSASVVMVLNGAR